jgi:hypothetical protein
VKANEIKTELTVLSCCYRAGLQPSLVHTGLLLTWLAGLPACCPCCSPWAVPAGAEPAARAASPAACRMRALGAAAGRVTRERRRSLRVLAAAGGVPALSRARARAPQAPAAVRCLSPSCASQPAETGEQKTRDSWPNQNQLPLKLN